VTRRPRWQGKHWGILCKSLFACLGLFWSMRGLQTLTSPQGTVTALLAGMDGLSDSAGFLVARCAGVVQAMCGLSQFSGVLRGWGAITGLVLCSVMLAFGVFNYGQISGHPCG